MRKSVIILSVLFAMVTSFMCVSCKNEVSQKAEYTVTFDVQGHGTAPAAKKVESGATLVKPDNPTADGWDFCGWFKEADCTNEWNFATDKVTADTVLYAKWLNSTRMYYFDGGSPNITRMFVVRKSATEFNFVLEWDGNYIRFQDTGWASPTGTNVTFGTGAMSFVFSTENNTLTSTDATGSSGTSSPTSTSYGVELMVENNKLVKIKDGSEVYDNISALPS